VATVPQAVHPPVITTRACSKQEKDAVCSGIIVHHAI
jgi:hypothetical protein